MSMAKTLEKVVWKAKHFRVTVFPEKVFEAKPERLWPQMSGIALEKQTISPKSGGNVLEGSYENQKVTLSVLPIRIDLLINTPEQIKMDSPIPVPDLGSLRESCERFNLLVEGFFKNASLPMLKRIAFGADLVRHVLSMEKGYEEVSKYIPFKVDPKNSSDFKLQINKPTTSKIKKGLKINRLTIWDVLKLNMELSSINNPKLSHKYPQIHFLHLALDINTAAEYEGTFNKEESLKLYKELVENALEITVKGVK